MSSSNPLGFEKGQDTLILQGDCRAWLREMPSASVDCVVTSPPYLGLRDYGHPDQIGLEDSLDGYTAELVELFRGVKRVLKPTGTVWLNLGDRYARHGGRQQKWGHKHGAVTGHWTNPPKGLKDKDLMGVPWRVAFALQADGWWLRRDIIWEKPNAQPENVRDRPVCSHEYLFLFSQSLTYHYDYLAVREPVVRTGRTSGNVKRKVADGERSRLSTHMGSSIPWEDKDGLRHRRSVWSIPTKAYGGGHFATYPVDLVLPCIRAGCPEGGVVLDPFGGAGTTAVAARQVGRRAALIELNPDYVGMIEARLGDGFLTVRPDGE